jgi:transcriptional regulator with XRE-family HTH domain
MGISDLLEILKQHRKCNNDLDLARLLGVSPSALCHYRSGVRLPSLAHCDELAHLLGMDEEMVASLVRSAGARRQTYLARAQAASASAQEGVCAVLDVAAADPIQATKR